MRASYDYAGRVVLITGGSRGIGAGIARAFRDAGAQVVICSRKEPENPQRGASFIPADVRDADQVDTMIDAIARDHGRLDVVVNNAGGAPHAMVADSSPRFHAKIIELNLIAPLIVSRSAHRVMRDSGGAIIMIGSISGVRPSPGTSAYGAAKAGLHHLAACLAVEWAPTITVNSVVVGLAETENAVDHYGGPTGLERVRETVPAGRLATPDDVADACLWLGSAPYVTGAQLLVHGGGETPAWQWPAAHRDVQC